MDWLLTGRRKETQAWLSTASSWNFPCNLSLGCHVACGSEEELPQESGPHAQSKVFPAALAYPRLGWSPDYKLRQEVTYKLQTEVGWESGVLSSGGILSNNGDTHFPLRSPGERYRAERTQLRWQSPGYCNKEKLWGNSRALGTDEQNKLWQSKWPGSSPFLATNFLF